MNRFARRWGVLLGTAGGLAILDPAPRHVRYAVASVAILAGTWWLATLSDKVRELQSRAKEAELRLKEVDALAHEASATLKELELGRQELDVRASLLVEQE